MNYSIGLHGSNYVAREVPAYWAAGRQRARIVLASFHWPVDTTAPTIVDKKCWGAQTRSSFGDGR